MRQSDHEYEERSFGDIQRAIDFENSMNDLESQLYYQHLSPKEVAQQVLKATCQFYDADWCGLIQVDLDLNLFSLPRGICKCGCPLLHIENYNI